MPVAKIVPGHSAERVPGVRTFYEVFLLTSVLEAQPFARVKVVAVCSRGGKDLTATYESLEVVPAHNSIDLA